MQLLPSTICEKSFSTILTKVDLVEVLKLYEDDLPSPQSLDVELSPCHTKWVDHDEGLAEDLDMTAKVLPHADVDYYPNICTIFVIMTTLPVTSSECEWSVSPLYLIKSVLQTTMSEDQLNGLAMMQCHHNNPLDPKEVIEEFARCIQGDLNSSYMCS